MYLWKSKKVIPELSSYTLASHMICSHVCYNYSSSSHVGIKGNEAADVKAKASLYLEISNFKLPCTDFKPFINRYILSKWQLSWDRATFNKLHEIKPVLGKNTIYRSLRREEVFLTRLRIGHTRLTHSYLLKREDQPFCISCNEPFTVKHFLIDCIEFSHMRCQFFQQMT